MGAEPGSPTPANGPSVCRCIVGGGLAGMMLGQLLARAGVVVVVLGKHDDFLRDFRGDTIHPSTIELVHELRLLDEFLRLPHREVAEVGALIGSMSCQSPTCATCGRAAPSSPLP